MQLDDERESDYVEDRRTDGGGGYGGDDPFGGTPYGPGGGGPYGGGPFGGGPSGGGPMGGFFGGVVGGLLGGLLSRSRGGDPYGGGPYQGGPYGGGPYGGGPYGGKPYGSGGGMGIGAKIAIGIAILAGLLAAFYFFSSPPRPAPAPTPRTQTMPPQVATQRPPAGRPVDPSKDSQAKLVTEMRKVLAKTEDTWDMLFKQMGQPYQKPKLVLFTNTTQSGCGQGRAATGPFYCPPDQRIYLDLRFFNEMEHRLKAGGDFARAYVIAHEVAHHVQNQMGIMNKVNEMRSRMSKQDFNKVSVRLELQADCFAGVWAHHSNRAKPFLDPGDIEEALRAASAVGDDTIQRSARGAVVPDSFTHGTSAQRMRWFKTGFETGSIKSCDTFKLPI